MSSGAPGVETQGLADEEKCLRELVLQERRDREAALSALGEAVEQRVKRVGEGLVQVLLEQAHQEREAAVEDLRAEVEARFARAAPGATPRPSPTLAAKLVGDTEAAKLSGITEGFEETLEMVGRERSEREARFVHMQEELDGKIMQTVEAVVSRLLRSERQASLESVRSEAKRCVESLRSEAGPQQADATGEAHAAALEKERHDREASLEALRRDIDARLVQMASSLEQGRQAKGTADGLQHVTALLEQESSQREASLEALRSEVEAQLARAAAKQQQPEAALGALLEQERSQREASLAALRSEVDAKIAGAAPKQQMPEAALDALLEHERSQREASLAALRSEVDAKIAGAAPKQQQQQQPEAALDALLEQERSQREASLAALRSEMDAKMAGSGARQLQPEAAFEALLEQERLQREASLEALRSEVEAQLAGTRGQRQPEATLDVVRREVRSQMEEAWCAAQDAHDHPADADEPAADASGTPGSGKVRIHEVSGLLGKQRSEVARLEGQLDEFREEFRRDITVLSQQQSDASKLVEQLEEFRQGFRRDIGLLKQQGEAARLEEQLEEFRREITASVQALKVQVEQVGRAQPAESTDTRAIEEPVRPSPRSDATNLEGHLEELRRDVALLSGQQKEAAEFAERLEELRRDIALLSDKQNEAAEVEAQLEKLGRHVISCVEALQNQVSQVEHVSATLEADVCALKEAVRLLPQRTASPHIEVPLVRLPAPSMVSLAPPTYGEMPTPWGTHGNAQFPQDSTLLGTAVLSECGSVGYPVSPPTQLVGGMPGGPALPLQPPVPIGTLVPEHPWEPAQASYAAPPTRAGGQAPVSTGESLPLQEPPLAGTAKLVEQHCPAPPALAGGQTPLPTGGSLPTEGSLPTGGSLPSQEPPLLGTPELAERHSLAPPPVQHVGTASAATLSPPVPAPLGTASLRAAVQAGYPVPVPAKMQNVQQVSSLPHASGPPSSAGSMSHRSTTMVQETPRRLRAVDLVPSVQQFFAKGRLSGSKPKGAAGKDGLGGMIAKTMSKTVGMTSKTLSAATRLSSLPPVVPLDLNEYLLRDEQNGRQYELPAGYQTETTGEVELLAHKGSGVKLWPAPLPLARASQVDVLLYHYTDSDSFRAICESPEPLVTLLQRAGRAGAEFGAGVYMTIHSPDHYGSKSAILTNMHSNSDDRATQLQHIEPHGSSADYCIAFLVRRRHVRDVMREATPEMTRGAGFTASGEPARMGRDIRVVSIDPVEEGARQLVDPIAAVRGRAAESLRELAPRGDSRAVDALLPRLEAERDVMVREAVVGALGEVAERGDAAACAALQRCLSVQGNGAAVREAAVLAIGKVAERGDRQTVEALARCLDGDPDRAVKVGAAFVLGRVALEEDVRAIEALTYRFEDEDEDRRVSAVAGQALKRLGVDVDVEDFEETVDEKSCTIS